VNKCLKTRVLSGQYVAMTIISCHHGGEDKIRQDLVDKK
jgi:hypothetical protein